MKTILSILGLFLIITSIFAQQNTWVPAGPYGVNVNNGAYAIQSPITQLAGHESFPLLLVAATQYGEIYKSQDGGQTWDNLSLSLGISRPITALEISPTQPNIIIMGSQSRLFKSIDGGASWSTILQIDNLRINEILIHPNNQDVVISTAKGLFKSTNQGQNWTKLDEAHYFDIVQSPADPNVCFLLKKEYSSTSLQLIQSADFGTTLTEIEENWDSNPISDHQGGKLTTSKENPDQIFIYLIGNQNTGDNNNLGVWQYSNLSETLTRVYEAAPYSDNHHNLSSLNAASNFTRGIEYCNIASNPLNSQELLVGSIHLFKSNDSGITFNKNEWIDQQAPPNFNLNVRDILTIDSITYLATDGGIYKSNDFFSSSNYEVITQQIQSMACIAMAQAWHKDRVATAGIGLGMLGKQSSYPDGSFKYLGGIENSWMTFNLYDEHILFNQELNSIGFPDDISINSPVHSNQFNVTPNASTRPMQSTNLCYRPNNYRIAFLGSENKLLRSNNMGYQFQTQYTFDPNYRVTSIEIPRYEAETMYVLLQHIALGSSQFQLMKSTDGGNSFISLPLPNGLTDKNIGITLDHNTPNRLVIAQNKPNPAGSIFITNNGGQTWTNIPNQLFAQESINSMLLLNGYNQPLIIATDRQVYRGDFFGNWTTFSNGLPLNTQGSNLDFFYKKGILRLASYNRGIWEMHMDESQAAPIATLSVNRTTCTSSCLESELFHFFDYSFVHKDQYQMDWYFQDGEIISGVEDYKKTVRFNSYGDKWCILNIVDDTGEIVSSDSTMITIHSVELPNELDITFESNHSNVGLDELHNFYVEDRIVDAPNLNNQGEKVFWINNKLVATNKPAVLPLNINLSSMDNPYLEFDIAYAQYPCVDDLLMVSFKTCEANQPEIIAVFTVEDILSTPKQQLNYFPKVNEWRRISLALNELAGKENIFIQMRHLNLDGNNMFLDNLMILNK